MKSLFIIAMAFSSVFAQASSFTAVVEDYLCVEIDPLFVGDVCILSVIKPDNKKLSIILNYDEADDVFSEGEVEGNLVEIKNSTLTKIRSAQVLRELLDYDNKYYYMYGEVDGIKLIDEKLNSTKEMKKLLKYFEGHFSPHRLPKEYSMKSIEIPSMNQNLKAFLKGMEAVKLSIWSDFVHSEDFNMTSSDSLESISENPWAQLGVTYLFEIYDVKAIYKNNILIGYFYSVSDHIQGQIYEDGAWWELFLDLDQNVLEAIEESA